ncbi:uncharacterized protein LY89DRAFT_737445 [Mollisia scopiformis]|uniref:Uncharacterized protein n=1 Tax=Mollisia scopiformis TaxID=149040 RepID=A0A194WZU1_MOLSC|nr:uncharacterized protein LY89DRAFT_737445 [Mollisia scopiformis]KUJ13465.1 hypothetical protein LY89DRAFT_737445 [Mollisia scopiformis]
MSTSPAKELVTLPLLKLQQLAELFAQALRETKERKPDVEYGIDVSHNTATSGTRTQIASSTARPERDGSDPAGHVTSSHPDMSESRDSRRNIITEIWKNVKKREFEATSTEKKEQPSLNLPQAKCRTIETVELLFQPYPASIDPEPQKWNKERAMVVAHRLRGLARDLDSEDINRSAGVLACIVASIASKDLEKPRLGTVLDICYQSGILDRPSSPNRTQYIEHASHVIRGLVASNEFLDFQTIEDSWRADWLDIFAERSLKEILGIELSALVQILHAVDPEPTLLETATGTDFRADDLNFKTLQKIGGLRVMWSQKLEDHLRLDHQNKIIYISWFPVPNLRTWREPSDFSGYQSFLLDNLPRTFLDSRWTNVRLSQQQLIGLEFELESSWAILFATGGITQAKRQAVYESLWTPSWHSIPELERFFLENPWALQEQKDRQVQQGHTYNNDFRFNQYADTLQHIQDKEYIAYDIFPMLETRLRQLRYYMDHRKPQSFRELWNDNHDPLNYYTFWCVIIFGALTIFLALLSLSVSIAQTWAAFRVLKQSN